MSPKSKVRNKNTHHRGVRPPKAAELNDLLVQFNRSQDTTGVKNLISVVSQVARIPGFEKASTIVNHLNNGEYVQAVSYSKTLLTQSYENSDETFRMSQIALLVKKYPFPSNEDLATANALKKFRAGERKCRHFNRVSRLRRRNNVSSLFFTDMQRYISRVLGRAPSVAELSYQAGWGPGSCVGVSGDATNFARKFLADEWTCTPQGLELALPVCKRLPEFWELLGLVKRTETSLSNQSIICLDYEEFNVRFRKRCRIVQHNEVLFAPKDADCYRTIAKEPLIDQLMQTAYGRIIARRLCHFGIDIRDQATNQLMARDGSLVDGSNRYCTIDLSNASGSICIELVRDLCPLDWLLGLSSCRAGSYSIDGSGQSRYSSFVSMGNAFCFPLQTLIFASICFAAHIYCGTHIDFRVYGDDIIVRQNEALVVLEALRKLGFDANTDKTFISGPFRESCGSDWYDGTPVRPVSIRKPLDSFEQLVRLHNAFARLPNAHAEELSSTLYSRFPRWHHHFIRPFGADGDEAIDGRFMHNTGSRWNKLLQCPSWFGFSFQPVRDKGLEEKSGYNVALMVGALTGASSKNPFLYRRKTKRAVRSFAYDGGHSTWLPTSIRREPYEEFSSVGRQWDDPA